jgi:hypothetical protein
MNRKEMNKLADICTSEIDKTMGLLQMMLDYGEYKKRILYKMTEEDWSKTISQVKNFVVSLLVSAICTGKALKGHLLLSKKHMDLQKKLLDEIIAKKQQAGKPDEEKL